MSIGSRFQWVRKPHLTNSRASPHSITQCSEEQQLRQFIDVAVAKQAGLRTIRASWAKLVGMCASKVWSDCSLNARTADLQGREVAERQAPFWPAHVICKGCGDSKLSWRISIFDSRSKALERSNTSITSFCNSSDLSFKIHAYAHRLCRTKPLSKFEVNTSHSQSQSLGLDLGVHISTRTALPGV